MSYGKVGVLFGGTSSEREISLLSGNAVLQSMLSQGIDAVGLDVKDYDLTNLKRDGFDRVFIALHGRGGEDGAVQGFLTTIGMPFTGSCHSSSAIGMNKAITKQIWCCNDLPTAQYKTITSDTFDPSKSAEILESLSGTLMVKPVHEGSSIGMAKVSNASELSQALENAFKYDHKVLLEAWITGQEYTVSILNGKALPAIKMKTTHSFYDYEAKYTSKDTEYSCPCGLDEVELLKLNKLAEEAFNELGCSGWGRVDFMLDESGKWYLLEVNTVPGMTETSLVPKAAKQAGLSFDQLILEILKQAC